MDFDDYVRHVTQKYSVALAIAIIKSKPENISTQEYVEILKSKITENRMEIDNIEVCSDDFNYDESLRNDDTQMENDANVSVTILNDLDFEHNSMNILRDVDEESETKKAKNNQPIIPFINEPTTSKAHDFLNINTDTENFVEIHNNNTTDTNDQDQNRNEHSILIDKKLADVIVKNLNKHNQTTNITTEIGNNMYYSNNITNINTDIEMNMSSNREINDTEIPMKDDTQSSKILENSYQNTENITYNEKDKLIDKITKNLNNNENETYIDTQETIPYTLHGFTENTHVSQSQSDNIEIEKHFIYGNKVRNKPIENSHKNSTTVPNTEGILSQVIDISNIVKVVENNGRKYIVINGNNSQNEREMNSQVNTQEMLEGDSTNEPTQLNSVTIDIEDNMAEEYSQAELVPFKIIEELNKIRSFLNKAADRRPSMDSSLSDSGYRSDSQSRSSFKSASNSSGNWLNQSAYSLFNYLTQCPLVASTEDIVNEIAVVLGKLIDRLHEEEKYPSFLEDILDNTDVLLRDVFEGDSSDDNVLLKKDENIQRIFLLNKSVHILKYTIEKITQKLEKLHTNLTKEDNLYELTNVEETENSCYLFHLLDILLKSYIKIKDTQSSSQTSQDENKMLKKSSITDIWRKKWNPNFKETGHSETLEKKCVLIKCSEVLNKIIVDCMSGYSLIAFAALNCFNLMQS